MNYQRAPKAVRGGVHTHQHKLTEEFVTEFKTRYSAKLAKRYSLISPAPFTPSSSPVDDTANTRIYIYSYEPTGTQVLVLKLYDSKKTIDLRGATTVTYT
jgi:hypothetical protein